MKKGLVLILVALFVSCGIAFAEEGFQFDLKQGFLMNWEDEYSLDNVSTFTLAKTKPVETWPTWANILWHGWSLDAGFAYDASALNTGAILIGREFGALGDYLPIEFPLSDVINLTAYPIGVSVRDLFDSPEFDICSGGAYVKLSIKTD